MTKVTIYKNANGAYTGLNVSGHAGYAAFGEDVVCAAVSTLTVNTLNSIDMFTDDSVEIVVNDPESGVIDCVFKGANGGELGKDSTLLMRSYETGVTELSKEYEEVNVSFICE